MEEEDAIFKALRVLEMLSDGRVLKLGSGYKIGMAKNGFVGIVVDGRVDTDSEVPFSGLVKIVTEEATVFCCQDEIK